jgi:two-component system nitrogen regulation sensor histidine kinase NtrY
MMTEKLSYQRHELIEANRQIDAKRHFSETIIAGVSAGIIALNLDRKITMINRTATNLLCVEENEILDHDFTDFCSEMEELRMQAENTPDYPAQGEIQIVRRGRKFILLVRCVAEQIDNAVRGYLITFDDVTALLAAQRSAAWADIARRIAHEIKNPLTPIRLAAERLKRKYSKEVGDEETFNKYATTIVRHVSDIGKIVEEFVQFARMPAPVFSDNNLGEMINNVIFSRQCIGTSIAYYFEDLSEPVIINCDPSQIEQVLLNLFKNAEESIELKSVLVGMINIKLYVKNKYAVISITDNGVGVPPELLDRITEPYVTNKVKGTGLGLAIVKKIIDDHGGVIQFSNLDSGGAHVKIFLPISKIP